MRGIYVFIALFVFTLVTTQLVITLKKESPQISDVFTEAENQIANQIIETYDGFILSKTVHTSDNGAMYLNVLNEMNPKAVETGNLDEVLIDFKERKKFYESCNQTSVLSFFQLKEYKKNLKIDSLDKEQYLEINIKGSFIQFCEQLGKKNSYIKSLVADIKAAGDISPKVQAELLVNYHQLDFNKKEERLVYAVLMFCM